MNAQMPGAYGQSPVPTSPSPQIRQVARGKPQDPLGKRLPSNRAGFASSHTELGKKSRSAGRCAGALLTAVIIIKTAERPPRSSYPILDTVLRNSEWVL